LKSFYLNSIYLVTVKYLKLCTVMQTLLHKMFLQPLPLVGPLEVVELPQVVVELPQVVVELPQVVVELPQVVVELPQVVVELPQVVVELPQVVALMQVGVFQWYRTQ
jgi:hypothetical protein